MATVVVMNEHLKAKVNKALGIISYTLMTYDRTAVACSFGKDSMVTLHLVRQINPRVKVFCITTPFKPPQTATYRERMTREWDLNIELFSRPDNINAANMELWKVNPDKCCDYFKVGPTKIAVANLDAWICGLRRDEGPTRDDYDYFETKGGLLKVNPILDFTEDDIWTYHAIHKIPSHPLYSEGYRSLGCSPCTESGGETERSGRWVGTNKQGGECGIHTQVLRHNNALDREAVGN